MRRAPRPTSTPRTVHRPGSASGTRRCWRSRSWPSPRSSSLGPFSPVSGARPRCSSPGGRIGPTSWCSSSPSSSSHPLPWPPWARSPASSIVLGGRHAEIDADVTVAVESAIGDDGPPVVVVTLDGLPTNLLLDGQGRIDAGLYPNLARLADQATWYRNNTTVAPITLEAVPAILSGTAPTDMASSVTSQYPHNLFTLLGGAYDVHASEQITALCPITLCPSHDGRVVPHLLRDARDVWDMQMEGTPVDEMLVPGAFDHRYESFSAWIDEQDFTTGDRPDLFFYHLLLPHDGWDYLPDGSRYGSLGPPSGLFVYRWGDWGIDVARQRHVLQAQASDVLLGKLFERLRDAGTYDDALVVVTADHGYSFEPNTPMRGLSKASPQPRSTARPPSRSTTGRGATGAPPTAGRSRSMAPRASSASSPPTRSRGRGPWPCGSARS